MALTVTIALTSGNGVAVVSGQPATYMVSITNSTASDVTLTGLQLVTRPPGAITGSAGPTSPQMNVTIPASAASALTVPVSVIWPAPQKIGTPAIGNAQYTVTAMATTSDGSVGTSWPFIQCVTTPLQGPEESDQINYVPGQLAYAFRQSTVLGFFFS